MQNFLRNKIGLILFFCSLLVYCLLKLPLDLSVVCAEHNEGFSFIYGQSFLKWKELVLGRGLLFVLAYATILKIFGFNTFSIVASHFVQTTLVILSAIAIYLIVNKTTKSNFFAGLSVLFWIVMLVTPIGTSGLGVEIRSHYALEPECFCILFSLYSILLLLLACESKNKIFSFLAAFLAVCSFMFKTTGAVLFIATTLWFLHLLVFRQEEFKLLLKNVFYYFLGLIFSLLFFNVVIYFLSSDLFEWWKNYFLIGSYSHDYIKSPVSFLSSVFNFMTRNTHSINNFLLFLFAFISFAWGIVRAFFIRQKEDTLLTFWPLISIWGIGNSIAIITPGAYQPYYYQLIWPGIAIIYSFALKELFEHLEKKIFVLILITIFFAHRIAVSFPTHAVLMTFLANQNIFNQPQSFQDPVLSYDIGKSTRHTDLRLADSINMLLPNKDSTFYVFSFHYKGYTGFTPLSYIYAKRYPPTTIECNLIRVSTILKEKLEVLKSNLIKRPPEILIIAKSNYFDPSEVSTFTPFINWFNSFIEDNYAFESTLDLVSRSENKKVESFIVHKLLCKDHLERNKQK